MGAALAGHMDLLMADVSAVAVSHVYACLRYAAAGTQMMATTVLRKAGNLVHHCALQAPVDSCQHSTIHALSHEGDTSVPNTTKHIHFCMRRYGIPERLACGLCRFPASSGMQTKRQWTKAQDRGGMVGLAVAGVDKVEENYGQVRHLLANAPRTGHGVVGAKHL